MKDGSRLAGLRVALS